MILFVGIALWALVTLGCFLLLASRRLRPLALPTGLAVGLSAPLALLSLWAVILLTRRHTIPPGRAGEILFFLAIAVSLGFGAVCGGLAGGAAGVWLNRTLGWHLRRLPLIEPGLRWWFGARPVRWTARRGEIRAH